MCYSAQACIACIIGFNLSSTTRLCFSPCPERFFQKSQNTCVACPYDCYFCDINQNCIACNLQLDFRQLNITSQRCSPVSGYFDNLITISVRCPLGCSSCLNLSLCYSCSNNYYKRSNQLCYTDCLPRFYGNIASKTCTVCPYDCYTCDMNNNCLSCNTQTDYRYLNSTLQRCVSLQGYFDNNITVSVKCPIGCSSCIS